MNYAMFAENESYIDQIIKWAQLEIKLQMKTEWKSNESKRNRFSSKNQKDVDNEEEAQIYWPNIVSTHSMLARTLFRTSITHTISHTR